MTFVTNGPNDQINGSAEMPALRPSLAGEQILVALIETIKSCSITAEGGNSTELHKKLASVLMEDPKQRIGRFLNEVGNYTVVLHGVNNPRNLDSDKPCYYAECSKQDDVSIELHIHVFAENLWSALTKAFDEFDPPSTNDSVRGRDLLIGSGGVRGDNNSSTGFEAGNNRRADYDIKAGE